MEGEEEGEGRGEEEGGGGRRREEEGGRRREEEGGETYPGISHNSVVRKSGGGDDISSGPQQLQANFVTDFYSSSSKITR
jgi:hypothetical protein